MRRDVVVGLVLGAILALALKAVVSFWPPPAAPAARATELADRLRNFERFVQDSKGDKEALARELTAFLARYSADPEVARILDDGPFGYDGMQFELGHPKNERLKPEGHRLAEPMLHFAPDHPYHGGR